MQRLADLIRRSLSLGVFLPLLALALVATWFGLGPSQLKFAGLTGGMKFVDVQPVIAPESIVSQMQAYSPEAVRYYLLWSGFDFAWPLLTFTAMMFIVAWLFRFLPAERQGLFTSVVAVGYAAVLMDWSENACFIGVALSAAQAPVGLARIAVAFHTAKLVCLTIFNLQCFGTLLWVLGRQGLALARTKA
jgi:hypothetical protein